MKCNKLRCITFFILIFGALGCRKTPKDNYTSKLNGTWIGTGSGYDASAYNGEFFSVFKITDVSFTKITGVRGDTLQYQSTDTKTHTVIFKRSYVYTIYSSDETLVYNYSDNTLIDDYRIAVSGIGGETIHLQAQPYTVNASIKNYISKIAGARMLSGIGYDTLTYRTPPDSMYTLNDTIVFGIVDSTTLNYDKDYFYVNKDLHYKSSDENAKIITFQTDHSPNFNKWTTLTYNYLNNTLVFEQTDKTSGAPRYLKLQ